ncbi:SYT5 [Linum grandiflorum]
MEMWLLIPFASGIAFGILLVFLLLRSQKSRSNRHIKLVNTLASYAMVTDLANPQKVKCLQSPTLIWLNYLLAKLWRYANEDYGLSESIKMSVESTLEEYRSIKLSSLSFSNFTLGHVAPQFTGISEVEYDGSGVTMELEVNWNGNPSIVLDVKMTTLAGVTLAVQVKDMEFNGVFRLIFKPLVEKLPCFGAVSYSLTEKKKLEFKLEVVGGGDIRTSIPGLYSALEETICNAIEDSMTWPVRKVIPILSGDFSESESLQPCGKLHVKLVQAKDLIGESDPYAVMYVRPLRNTIRTTEIMSNDPNPIWNEVFEFVVDDQSTQQLHIKIFDDEDSQLLGCAQVALKELQVGEWKSEWLKLVKDLEDQRDGKYQGQVHLELFYCPFGQENNCVSPFAKKDEITTLAMLFERSRSRPKYEDATGTGKEVVNHRNGARRRNCNSRRRK